MIKFTKGQQAWQFLNWNNLDTVAYRLVTIESWGAKTGTVSIVDAGGKMSKSRVYTQSVNQTGHMRNNGGEHYFAATEGFDPVAKATELAAEYIKQAIAQGEEHKDHPAFHQPSVKAQLAKLQAATPTARAWL